MRGPLDVIQSLPKDQILEIEGAYFGEDGQGTMGLVFILGDGLDGWHVHIPNCEVRRWYEEFSTGMEHFEKGDES